MMEMTCPICKGAGVAAPHAEYNQVHWGDGEYKIETCWGCGGSGKVMKQDSEYNIYIHKYWRTDASQNKEAGQQVDCMES